MPREWADKYRGRFDQGWDALREETFARQKELGVIPQGAELTRRHDEIPAWDDMDEDLKPVLRWEMENYAGFLENTDHHVGRLIDALAELEVLDNTLIYYIIGDNGASAEGSLTGTFNSAIDGNGGEDLKTTQAQLAQLDNWGGPESYPHYAVGWAHAMCTPYQWTKQVASHWGGTRNGTIVHWPAHIQARVSCAISSTMSSMSPRRCWRRPGCPSRSRSTASPRSRCTAPACATASTTRTRPSAMRPSTSR